MSGKFQKCFWEVIIRGLKSGDSAKRKSKVVKYKVES